MSETEEPEIPEDETQEAPEIPEHLKELVAQFNEIRMSNAQKIKNLDGMAQTDIRLMLAIVRLNLLVDAVMKDGEDRLFFELSFERQASTIADQYLSQAIQAQLLQR